MDANIAVVVIFIAMAVVSWIPYLGWVAWAVPIVFFMMEKSSRFVKFYAVQALGIGVVRAALAILFQIIVWIMTPRNIYSAIGFLSGGWGAWVVVGTISTIIGIIITIIVLYVLIKAYGYKYIELPFIGPIAVKKSDLTSGNK